MPSTRENLKNAMPLRDFFLRIFTPVKATAERVRLLSSVMKNRGAPLGARPLVPLGSLTNAR